MSNIISMLTDKDNKAAFAKTKEIASESEFSDKYYNYLPEFADLLSHQKSYIRTRAFILCCSQARWDTEGKLKSILPQLLKLFHDKKPTVVRVCLNAAKEIAVFRPELGAAIQEELNQMELSIYKDSMAPLIQKDINELLKVLE